MDLMDVRREMMGVIARMASGGLKFGLLSEITDIVLTGNFNEQTVDIVPAASWSQYNFLLIVPDLEISNDDTTNHANQFWIRLSDGTTQAAAYDGYNVAGPRGKRWTLTLIHDDDGYWYLLPYSSSVTSKVIRILSNANLSEITIQIGQYYKTSAGYGTTTGTIRVYGGQLAN